jgi:hypothetical protein
MIKISSKEAQQQIDEILKNANRQLTREVDKALSELAHSAFATIQSKAQQKLTNTRQDYLKSLKFEKLSDEAFLITLEGEWADAIENGFAPFNITEKMLQSQKVVNVGSRAGAPWVQTAKAGHKYARVPLPPKRPKGATMSDALKDVYATNYKGLPQRITQIFKDDQKNVLQGKVAYAEDEGITKYQRSFMNKNGNAEKQLVKNIRQIAQKLGS